MKTPPPALSAKPAVAAKAVQAPAVSAAPPVPAVPAEVTLRLASDRLAFANSAPLVNLRITRAGMQDQSVAPSPDADKGWRLRPILDAIGAHAGGGVAGQLLVYKIFLQLPPDLLKAVGLKSLNDVDDQFTVRLPALRAAIADAARKHANLDVATLVNA